MQCVSIRAQRVAAFKASSRPCAPVLKRTVPAQWHEGRQAVIALAKGKGGKGGGKGSKSDDSDSDSGSKGGKGGKAAVDTAAGDWMKVAAETKKDTEERMKKALNVVADNFNTIRTGRANPAILDKITVDYFGTPTPIKSMGSITVPEATTLVITPFDKSSLRDIERALLESDIGINPNNDGERIRLVMPPMTQERRKDLVKSVSKMGEEGKVAVRNVRKDSMKKADKVEFPKDDKKALEDAVQKLTDTYCKKLDDMVKAKSDELMKV